MCRLQRENTFRSTVVLYRGERLGYSHYPHLIENTMHLLFSFCVWVQRLHPGASSGGNFLENSTVKPSHLQPPATTSVQNLLYGYAFVFSGPRYGFGWENQLLETAFLAAFAVPLLSLRPFAPACPTPAVIPWLYKWLAFRVMFGAGLIKIRGDKAWKDLTAMDYHYETQPLPNPISYFLHQAPKKFHR